MLCQLTKSWTWNETLGNIFKISGVAYGSTSDYIELQFSVLNHLQPSNSLGFGKLTAEFILGNAAIIQGYFFSIAHCSLISPYLPFEIH